SLVVQDLGGGRISTVTYDSREPITKTLKTFSIDLTENPTLADLLEQIRGERIEIEAPNKITGIIASIERRKVKLADETIDREFLNLLTDGGVRSMPLDSVSSIRLLDAELQDEFRKALSVLALGHQNEQKAVTL